MKNRAAYNQEVLPHPGRGNSISKKVRLPTALESISPGDSDLGRTEAKQKKARARLVVQGQPKRLRCTHFQIVGCLERLRSTELTSQN